MDARRSASGLAQHPGSARRQPWHASASGQEKLNGDTIMIRHPFLDQPAPAWKRDLPRPDETPALAHNIWYLATAPTEISDVYMELPTSPLRSRGVVIWLGLMAIAASLIPLSTIIFVAIIQAKTLSAWIVFAGFSITLIGAWFGVFTLRSDLYMPRNQPIRFNRLRRKVYAYHFDMDWKRPFSKKGWGVRVATYRWEDLHAEVSEIYGAMGTGGHIQTVYLSARKPGTKDVAHRFVLSLDLYQGESYWEAARIFMEYGMPVMPTFQYASKDRNNESSPLNIFWRFAPQVQWPEHIDLESRTAPTPAEQK